MEGLKLWTVAVVLGLGIAGLNFYGLINPSAFGRVARSFSRHKSIGYPLMLLATGWFLFYVKQENVADFVAMKPFLYALFGVVGVGACLFLHDFLPVRSLAALLLLGAKLIVDTARWVESDWRLVLVVLAYAWVLLGMWLTISPWRLRDWIQWATANDGRIRALSGLKTAFGLFVALIGFALIRPVEHHASSVGLPVPAVRTASLR